MSTIYMSGVLSWDNDSTSSHEIISKVHMKSQGKDFLFRLEQENSWKTQIAF